MKNHILAIGCTGMLQQTIALLLKDGNHISLVGRNQTRLDYFENVFPEFKNQIHLINVDYSNWTKLQSKIENREFDILICWMHNHAIEVKNRLFKYLVKRNRSIQIFELNGSSFADPSKQPVRTYPKTKKIILGFKIENEKSRWLSNQEIANGTYQAIKSKNNYTVIGVTEPWNKRP